MQYYFQYPLSALIILLLTTISYAAAWVQPINRYALINTYYWLSSYKLYTNPDIKFSKHGFSQDIEYGATSDITLGINHQVEFGKFNTKYKLHNKYAYCYHGHGDPVSCKYANSNDYGCEGKFSFYFRKLLWQNQNTILSIQPFLNINEFEPEIRILLGRNFNLNKKNHFFNLEMAVRKRENAPDELLFDVTEGVYLPYKFILITQFFIKYHLNKRKHTDQYLSIYSHSFNNDWFQHSSEYTNNNIKITKNPYYHPLIIMPKISIAKVLNDNYTIQLGVSTDMSLAKNKKSQSKLRMISLSLWFNI